MTIKYSETDLSELARSIEKVMQSDSDLWRDLLKQIRKTKRKINDVIDELIASYVAGIPAEDIFTFSFVSDVSLGYLIYKAKKEEMPVYIFSNIIPFKIIALWRISIGK